MGFTNIIFWIIFVFAVIFALWYIIGDSPTLEQGLLLFILSMVIKNKDNIKNLNLKIDKIEKK